MTIELYDQEEVFRSYVEGERYEAAEKAKNATKIEIAKRLLKMEKLSVEEIAAGIELTVEEVGRLTDLLLT